MNMPLRWWYIPIILVVIPIVYSRFRRPAGLWDLQVDTMYIAGICYSAAIFFTLAYLIA